MDAHTPERPRGSARGDLRATALLRAEHDVILGVAAAAMRALDGGGRLSDEGFWHDVIAFFRGFAEDRHHAKEDAGLLPLLEMRGMPRATDVSLEALRREHEEERDLIDSVAALHARLDPRKPELRAAFLRAAREYCARLARHIAHENGAVFPVADRLLSPSDQREILKVFRAHQDAADDSLLALADRLRGAY